VCFAEILGNVYQQFKKTEGFKELTEKLTHTYNFDSTDDFEYMNKLGEGGFGFVVHCKKKSTGKHYAMKIQTKSGLLECFADDPKRADFEKQAFASCQHPFVINMDYAFQTPSLAIMVLGLAVSKFLCCGYYYYYYYYYCCCCCCCCCCCWWWWWWCFS
jgi:serine/threonine protein kinase